MRPGQNKRLRGRSGRKGPNPLTRSFESNGPDVKIRGTAQHVAEKYLQLARDAQSSGDIVLAENLLQHAEHYFRMIAAAQQQQANGYGGRQSFEAETEEEDDDDFTGVQDRFASLSERLPPVYSPQAYQAPQPPTPQHFTPPPQPQSQPQPFEERPIGGGGGDQPRHERPARPPFQGRGRGYDRGVQQDRSGENQGEPGARAPQYGYGRDRNRFQQRREQNAAEAAQPGGSDPSGLPAFITGGGGAPARSEPRSGEEQEGGDFTPNGGARRRGRREQIDGDAAPASNEATTGE